MNTQYYLGLLVNIAGSLVVPGFRLHEFLLPASIHLVFDTGGLMLVFVIWSQRDLRINLVLLGGVIILSCSLDWYRARLMSSGRLIKN